MFTAAIQCPAPPLASRRPRPHFAHVTLAEKQRQLIDDLLILPDAQERLAAIVDRVKNRPPLPATERIEAHRVKGCVSLAWVVGEGHDGHCCFRSDADSPLVRGLVALLTDLYSNATPTDILTTEPTLIAELGLDRVISPTRLNGLRSVTAKIREFSAAASAAQ
jgi:cysteine desulfuration protein SufE